MSLGPPKRVQAHTFEKKWETFSHPVLLECDDGGKYVVKSTHAGRSIVTDQIVGALGHSLGAPVPPVVLVNVTVELIAAEPQMSHMNPGVAHGSTWLPGCTERENLTHVDANLGRFALLAVLFGWTQASDHQFIYTNDAPHQVWSVDHGHFFPGGPTWTTGSLMGGAAPCDIDPTIAAACAWPGLELQDARQNLDSVSDELISNVVAWVPDGWGLYPDERVVLTDYLSSRRATLLKRLDERIASA